MADHFIYIPDIISPSSLTPSSAEPPSIERMNEHTNSRRSTSTYLFKF